MSDRVTVQLMLWPISLLEPAGIVNDVRVGIDTILLKRSVNFDSIVPL